jgi:MOSC domain-containing protein YiiM
MQHGPSVVAVHRSAHYTFSKPAADSIRLLEGLGVDGDIHAGVTVKHRSRIARDPSAPNLRQVHLIHSELHEQLRTQGFEVGAGQMGENITTRGIDLLGLPAGSILRFGDGGAAVRVTGLRNPCGQLNGLQEGLMNACVYKDEAGATVRLAGVMAVVLSSGDVRPGDAIAVEPPVGEPVPLEPV